MADKIKILDNSLIEIDKGYEMVEKIHKKQKAQDEEIQNLIESISVHSDKKKLLEAYLRVSNKSIATPPKTKEK